jgi:hypothetical protein
MSSIALQTVLVVRLVSAGHVPEQVLPRAEKAAAEIFARAGVRIEWVDCRVKVCGDMPGPWVQFLDRSRGSSGYAVIAPEASGYAVVRYPVVLESAADLQLDVAPLLGATIAHELGHLLLGKQHHGQGVMAARFRTDELLRAARGELQFTDDEARRMRGSVYLTRETPPTTAAR